MCALFVLCSIVCECGRAFREERCRQGSRLAISGSDCKRHQRNYINLGSMRINHVDSNFRRSKTCSKTGAILSADFVEESKKNKAPTRTKAVHEHIINAAGSRGAQGEAQEAHVVRSGVQAHSRQGRAAAPTAEPHQAHLRSLPGHRALPGGSQPPFRTRSGGGRASRAAAVPSLEGGPSARSPALPPSPPAPRLHSGSRPPHLMSA